MSRDVIEGAMFVLGCLMIGLGHGEAQAIGAGVLFYLVGREDGRRARLTPEPPAQPED